MENRVTALEKALNHYIQADTEHRSRYGAGIISQVKRKEYAELVMPVPRDPDEVIEIELGGRCEYYSPENMDRDIEELR